MNSTPLLQALISHFIHSTPDTPDNKPFLLPDEKNDFADIFLHKGEKLLLEGNIEGKTWLKEAESMNPNDAEISFRLGLAWFNYGTENKEKKSLMKAHHQFQKATEQAPENFRYWWAWGDLLLTLSQNSNKRHFLNLSKEKYEQASAVSGKEDDETLAAFYWQFARLWFLLSQDSGETYELRKAILSMKKSLGFKKEPSAKFWFRFGCIYIQMGLLINDDRAYFQAIEYLSKSLEIRPRSAKTLQAIAQCYTQLYINTMDEEYFSLANHHFDKAASNNNKNGSIFLEWAQLLGESGKTQKDPEKLQLCIKKCITAYRLLKSSDCIGQWVEALSHLGVFTNQLPPLLTAEKKILKQAKRDPLNPDLWFAYGVCLKAFGAYYNDMAYQELAIEQIQKGLSLDRSHPELWHLLGNIHYQLGFETEDTSLLLRAHKFYLKAIDLKASYPQAIIDCAKNLLKLGELKSDKGLLTKAFLYFESMLNQQNDAIISHPDWLFHYGLSLDFLGHLHNEDDCLVKAAEVFHNVLLISPKYPRIYYHLALALSHLADQTLEGSHYQKALNFFKLAAKKHPEDDLIYLEWGLTLTSLADQTNKEEIAMLLFRQAEQKLLKAGLLGNQHAYYHLACVYSLRHQSENAIDFLKKAQRLDVLPSLEDLMDDEWLDPIKGSNEFQVFLAQVEKPSKTR